VIVDAHTHLMRYARDLPESLASHYLRMYEGQPSWRTGNPYTIEDWCVEPETLIADLDRAGVDRAVVMTLGSAVLGGHDPSLAAEVASWCAQYPERLIGMLTADPLGGAAEARRVLRDVTGLGLRGVKMLPSYSHVALNDRRLWPIYEAVAEIGVPLVLHTGWCAIPAGRTLAHDHPLQIEDLLADFDGLRVVVAHCGFAWSEHVLFMLAGHPTAYADVAYWSQVMPRWRAAMTLSHAKHLGVLERLLWGTDYPFVSQQTELAYWRAVPDAAASLSLDPAVTADDVDLLLGRNAAALFGHLDRRPVAESA
jgi:predicted TIM-barrel fold metal-dependent hydrolase